MMPFLALNLAKVLIPKIAQNNPTPAKYIPHTTTVIDYTCVNRFTIKLR